MGHNKFLEDLPFYFYANTWSVDGWCFISGTAYFCSSGSRNWAKILRNQRIPSTALNYASLLNHCHKFVSTPGEEIKDPRRGEESGRGKEGESKEKEEREGKQKKRVWVEKGEGMDKKCRAGKCRGR